MKIEKFGLVLITATILFALLSCNAQLLSDPKIPGGSVGKGLAPEGLYASHGEKRSITLSWMQRSDATLYYVYRADSPLDTFVRCGETAANQIKFNTAPGSTIYYRVSSVSSNGTESPQSAYVRGTSLAQPIITDIADLTESSAEVTWYMDNVSDDSYKSNLLYTVYCYNGSAEVAQIALDGAIILENRAIFSGLNANTNYEYVVEAYLRSDQNVSEKSDKMDAATARRFRPGPPEMLRATRGTSIDEVVLSFELPDMVDIALGDNQYDPKPVYFVISKRLYSETHANDYQKVCSYFGSIQENAAQHTDSATFGAYIPGAFVTWKDTNVKRGVAYEYQVQSYVDDTLKVISSDTSKASAEGWALSDGSLSFGKPEYTLNDTGDFYESAKLLLDFKFDPKGIVYEYVLKETHTPVDESGKESDTSHITRELIFENYDDIRTCTFEMYDLDSKDGQYSDRGLYSYAIEIKPAGEGNAIDTITTYGLIEISEITDPIVVDDFYVQDGFTDKFVLRWKNQSNIRYTIYQSNDRKDWEKIGTVNDNPSGIDVIENFSHVVPGQTASVSKYFAIQPSRDIGGQTKNGQMVYAQTASQTLGIPKLHSINDAASYSFITVTWDEAQKADAYRVKYWYTGTGEYETATTASTIQKNALVLDGNNRFRYSFQPEGHNDVVRAGLELQVAVDALNQGLWTTVGGEEIATTSKEELKTHLVGPAQLHAAASRATSTTDITVTWNTVTGANGYYVYRRQFNMANTAEAGAETVVYYVPAAISSSNNLIGKNLALDSNNSKIDTLSVKATASFAGSKYTLTDMSMPDSDYNGTTYNRHTPIYRDQQNDMAQGCPYRYYVVPVIMRGGAPEPLTSIDFEYAKDGANKNTNITLYTMRENNTDIRYSGAAAIEQEGFVTGFGQNVVATKGTHATVGTDGRNYSSGIKITWSAPPRLTSVASFNPRYTLYRRASGSSTWDIATSNINATEYVDVPQIRGVAYEYVVSITGNSVADSQPQHYQRFVDLCYTLRDEKQKPNMLGYVLDMVKMQGVTRGENTDVNAQFGEVASWYSTGIKSSASSDNNWGIDGYELFVMNLNIDALWHPIADMTNLLNQTNQSVMVTNQMGGGGLLKVLRDYKHFFKVRSYVVHDGEKIYCPDPPYTYSYQFGTNQTAHVAAGERMQTDYVKWGARQITAEEFLKISSLYIARGLERRKPSGDWLSTLFYGEESASGTWGGSGNVGTSSNAGVTSWTWQYNEYKDDLQTRTGQWMTFVTVSGKTWTGTKASGWPERFGDQGWMDIKGPWDTPNLYTGKIRFGGDNDDLYWDRGNVYIIYPSANMTARWKNQSSEPLCEKRAYRGEWTAFPYTGHGSVYRLNLDEWK